MFLECRICSLLNDAVHKCVPEPPSAFTVGAKLVDAPSLTVAVAKFVRHKVEKNCLDLISTKNRFVKLAETAEKKKDKVEDGI